MTGNTEQELFRFGVIADVQYCDIPDAYNFSKTQLRRYRGSITSLKHAVSDFNKSKVSFVAQLGDLIDGQNAGSYGELKGKPSQTDSAIKAVLKEFDQLDNQIKIYHSVGNHELYNFTWEQLLKKLNRNSNEAPTHKVSEENSFYFSFKQNPGWRIIQLNPYEVSLMQRRSLPGFKAAVALLKEKNPNFETFFINKTAEQASNGSEQLEEAVRHGAMDFSKGMARQDLFYCPFNGGLLKLQLDWFEQQLSECKVTGERVILLSHVPLSVKASSSKTLVYNAKEVLEVIEKHPQVVKMVLSGHSNHGGYYFDVKKDLAFLTAPSPLLHENSHAIISVFQDRIEVNGVDGFPSRTISFSNKVM